ncbi:MAG: protein-glutamate O-methyltransferase CheR [Sandaracinaceae bacterium]|nr:protein-glutamate O-methyltransferase CheR [Sandaracinaceae bacterium]
MRRDEFRLLRDLVNQRSGMFFDDSSFFVFERRLRERAKALGVGDFTSYYQHLRFHPRGAEEIEEAIDALVTNETYFFREEYQLRAFGEDILPRLHEQAARGNRKRLVIWSAGCSTGEEVYTLAILVLRSRLFDGWDVRVFGNDISKRVLGIARRGVYPRHSFRAMPPLYDEYFEPDPSQPGGSRRVVDRVRALCQFGHFNLLERERASILGRVDAIFCRNVLIYFDPTSRRGVIDSFYDRLQPGGYLMLGHSESLLNLSTAFELAHLASDMVYRRPVASHSLLPPRREGVR